MLLFFPKVGLLLPVYLFSCSRQRLHVNALLTQGTGTLSASAFMFPGTVAAFLVLHSCSSSNSLYHLLRKCYFLPSSKQSPEVTASKGGFGFSTPYFYWEICPSGFCCRFLVSAVPGIVIMTILQGAMHSNLGKTRRGIPKGAVWVETQCASAVLLLCGSLARK